MFTDQGNSRGRGLLPGKKQTNKRGLVRCASLRSVECFFTLPASMLSVNNFVSGCEFEIQSRSESGLVYIVQ